MKNNNIAKGFIIATVVLGFVAYYTHGTLHDGIVTTELGCLLSAAYAYRKYLKK